jgi:type I restriction enzyme S subunit
MSAWKVTEYGKIPSRWELKKVSEIKGLDKRAIAMDPFGSNIKAENFVDKGVPVIRGTNMNYYKYVDGEFVYLTEDKADELIGSNCKAGDIVFTHRGTIGQVALIPSNKFDRYVISQSGMKLTVNPEIVNNEFLLYFFKSEFGQFQILKYEAQVGVPSISNPLTSLKEIEVPVPPLPEQIAIAEVLSSLDDKIDLLDRQNKTLEQLAETLFRQLFVEDNHITKPLGELSKVTTGKGLKRNEFIEKGTYPIIGANGEIGRTDKYLTDERLIITGRVGTLGEVKITDVKVWISDNVLIIKPNEEIYFYPIYFSLKKFDFENINAGSTQPLVTQTDLKNIDIHFGQLESILDFQAFCKEHFQKIKSNTQQIRTLTQLRDTLLPKLISGEVRVAR